MIPRYGNPPRRGTAYRARPGAYALLIRDDRILLTVQETSAGEEVQLPGGGIDPGESARPALLREILEETGHTATILRRLTVWREFTWMPDYGRHTEKLCHVYLGRPGLRLGPAREAGHRALWLPLAAARERIAQEGGRRALARWLARPRQAAASTLVGRS
ncbi:NUDIX domain-containing protein [uncultured Jannaschia sp.]|uniref:NUDIX domain-containing protein n=1 Tax=uncultured Jannaschia sp. TaxID=293347 RepID=UPI00261C3846|nr:NUDIX domain-containing protein [uncultured Jannaschia sp.]